MDLGQAIKTLRQQQGMTQGQLAERCDVSTTQVCSWETGKAYPPKGMLERICGALGVPQSYLMLTSVADEVPASLRELYNALAGMLRNEQDADAAKETPENEES